MSDFTNFSVALFIGGRSKRPLALKNLLCLVSPASLSFDQTVRSTMVPHRPCPSLVRSFRTCSGRSTLLWRRTIQREENTSGRFNAKLALRFQSVEKSPTTVSSEPFPSN